MGSSKMGDEEWDNWDWDCNCDSPPPPVFYLPPPPLPPGMPPPSTQGCSVPWTCGELGAATPEDLLTPAPRAHLAVVLISAITFVGLVIVAAVILYRSVSYYCKSN